MTQETAIERLPTGIDGLDTILRGGFSKGGIYIVQGAPGAGKTTLANQICFHHAHLGSSALYVTLLAETHSRMLIHLRTMRFFDPNCLMDKMTYISGLPILQDEGLTGLVTVLRREIASRKAGILVIDGLVAAEDEAKSDSEFKRFIQELQTQAGLYGCTVFLLTSARGAAMPPEHTMVDGIIELADIRYGARAQRSLYVRKLRGSGYLEGQHQFRITSNGLELFPRLETLWRNLEHPTAHEGRAASKIEKLDQMLGGGIPQGTVTGILGPSGIGKTTLGMHFLQGVSADEPGLYFGFYEPPACLQQQAGRLGLDFAGLAQKGHLEIIWTPQGEHLQDALAHQLLADIDRRGVKRLFLDGLDGFLESTIDPGRASRFFASLSNELRSRGVTTFYTMETKDLIGPGIRVPVTGISSLVENIIVLRFVERHSCIQRLLSIVKVRHSRFDPQLRKFTIEDGQGMTLGDTFGSAEEILSGYAHDHAEWPSSSGGA